MARSGGKRRDDGNECNRERSSHRESDLDSFSEDSRERKVQRRERKGKKYKRVKKERKRRERDDKESASDEQQVRVEERSNRHRYKRKKTDDRHGQKQGMKGAVEELKALSEEDYFLKNNEFSTWLKKEQGMFFSNLSSEVARMLFLKFVSAWNSGELHNEYYEGMSSAPRTDHNWGLKGVKKTLSEGVMDPIEEREITKKFDKSKRKKFQKMQEVVLDELLPKVTEPERMLEKRSLNRGKTRGKDSPEPIKEKDLFGRGDDFHARLDRESKRRQKKEMKRSAVFVEKLQASRQKEAEAMN